MADRTLSNSLRAAMGVSDDKRRFTVTVALSDGTEPEVVMEAVWSAIIAVCDADEIDELDALAIGDTIERGGGDDQPIFITRRIA